MFDINKMPPLVLTINIPQIFTIYDIYVLRKLSKDFEENILGAIILV